MASLSWPPYKSPPFGSGAPSSFTTLYTIMGFSEYKKTYQKNRTFKTPKVTPVENSDHPVAAPPSPLPFVSPLYSPFEGGMKFPTENQVFNEYQNFSGPLQMAKNNG